MDDRHRERPASGSEPGAAESGPSPAPDAQDDAARRRALEVVGAFRSGKHDVSECHDEYLSEAYRGEEEP